MPDRPIEAAPVAARGSARREFWASMSSRARCSSRSSLPTARRPDDSARSPSLLDGARCSSAPTRSPTGRVRGRARARSVRRSSCSCRMLFLLPLGLVPLAVAAGIMLANVAELVEGRIQARTCLRPARQRLLLARPGARPRGIRRGAAGARRRWPMLRARRGARRPVRVRLRERRRCTRASRSGVSPRLFVRVPERRLGASMRRSSGRAAGRARGGRPACGHSCSCCRSRACSARSRASAGLASTTRSSSAMRTAAPRSCSATSSRPTTPTPARTAATSSRSRSPSPRSSGSTRAAAATPSSWRCSHDVGKIRIPNEIINKPGPLTPEERACRDAHRRRRGDARPRGRRARERRPPRPVLPRALRRRRLSGRARRRRRSRSSRASSALRRLQRDHHRPALPRRPPAEEALAELRRCAGTQFDPAVVDALERVAAEPVNAGRGRPPGKRGE